MSEQTGIKGFFFPESLLGKLYRDLILGYSLLILGVSYLMYKAYGPGDSSLTFLWQTFGCFIISAPLLLKIWFLGGSPFMFWRDYQVVTTYSDGTKSSDYGAQSAVLKLIITAVMIYVGVAIQGIKLIYLTIRYIIAYSKEDDKPAFIKSGLLIIIAAIALLIVCPKYAGYSGRVAYDKDQEKKYTAKIKSSSTIQPAQIRSMLEEAQKKFLASHLEYLVYFGSVTHNGQENTTTVDIAEKEKPPKEYLAGVYHFKNGNFDRFEDKYNTKRTPNNGNIEAAKAFTLHYLFDTFLNTKDSDLWGEVKRGSEILRRGVDWKNALLLTFMNDSTGDWIWLKNNNFPNHYYGLRGADSDLRPKTVSSGSFPFLASVTKTVSLENYVVSRAYMSVERGEEVTVLSESSGYFLIEYRNQTYQFKDKENLTSIRSTPNVYDKPAEFNREYPFDAIVTEDISIMETQERNILTIPKGATVTVTETGGRIDYGSGVQKLQARVLYDGQTGEVSWRYLKLAD